MSSALDVEQHGRVRVLILNRPDKGNALTGELWSLLGKAVEDSADDPGTSVIVLRGAGKGFSSGVDLGGGYGSEASFWEDRERLRRTFANLDRIFDCPLPVIAAVHGYALGGGADLALHCDFLLAADDALIGHPAVRNAGVAPTNMWIYRLGPQLAKRLLLTGDKIRGDEAVRIGLALMSCPAEELLDASMEFAQRVALVDRDCLMGNKAVVNRGLDLMGRRLLNQSAQVEDAVAHLSTAATFRARVEEKGLRGAVEERDAPFLPEPTRISGPRRRN